MNYTDLTGKHFGRREVIKRLGSRKHVDGKNRPVWLVRCACGKTQELFSSAVKRTTHCGCARAELLRGKKGADCPGWKGGRSLNKQGYVLVGGAEKLLEHRVVMEAILGRELLNTETVHHKNGIRSDNRPENLELRASQHGPGQSVEDLVCWAQEILKRYKPEMLR